MAAHVQTLNAWRQVLAIKETLFSELLNMVFANTVGLRTGLILLLAAGVMQQGSFRVGDLALFVFYLSWLGEVTHFMGRLTARFQQMGVSLERVLAIERGSHATLVRHGPIYQVEAQASAGVQAGAPLQVLEVCGLTYRYPSSRQGIQDISFSLRPGSLTVVCGRFGAGKTTLLRTLLGLLPRDGGSISWNGMPVEAPGDFFLPPRSAYLPQSPHIFQDTLRENLLLGQQAAEEGVRQALLQAVLEEDVVAMERGLETPLGAGGIEPSGGQKQRIAAARMMLRRAELLVMDDLSSALDQRTARLLWVRLRAPATMATLLIASTRPAVLQRADTILLLEDGRVLDQGSLAELVGPLCCHEGDSCPGGGCAGGVDGWRSIGGAPTGPGCSLCGYASTERPARPWLMRVCSPGRVGSCQPSCCNGSRVPGVLWLGVSNEPAMLRSERLVWEEDRRWIGREQERCVLSGPFAVCMCPASRQEAAGPASSLALLQLLQPLACCFLNLGHTRGLRRFQSDPGQVIMWTSTLQRCCAGHAQVRVLRPVGDLDQQGKL